VHFVLGSFSEAHGGSALNTRVVVIGVGNTYRRDDGVGPAVAAAINEQALPGVRVVTGIEDPMNLLEAWSGAALALLVDAAVVSPSMPGRIHRVTADDVASVRGISSHSLDVAQVFALGQTLGRAPDRLVVFTVETADVGHGVGLTPQVSSAVPDVVAAVLAEIDRGTGAKPQLERG
jgi:hydrogenase maturation protease